jgi:pimeloyl-ACP methyl ester carboxylesterase
MSQGSLKPAFHAQELLWELPGAGQTVCYHRPGEGRPVLLLHSINGAASAYEVSPFFTQMQLPGPLYAPDLPGFGRSDREDRVYSAEFYADAIVAMARAIGRGAVDVIALSTSSEFAARAALMAPDLFRSLTLVSPTGFVRRRASRSPVGARIHRVLRQPLIGAGLFRLLRSRASVRFFLDKAFADGAPQEMVDYACLSAAQPGARHAPFYFVSGQLFDPDAVGSLYLPLSLPVLVLYDEDPNISFNYLDEVVSARSNWQRVRIAPTLGLPQFEQPEATANAVLEFWSSPPSVAMDQAEVPISG